MVIQRWQSLLLFIGVILMAIFSVSAYAYFTTHDGIDTGIYLSENIGYWILNILIAFVLFLSIFAFRNLKVQKLLVLLSILMMVASAIWGLLYVSGLSKQGVEVHLTYSWILLIVSFGLAIISLILINADQKLLKSYDRLR